MLNYSNLSQALPALPAVPRAQRNSQRVWATASRTFASWLSGCD